MAAPPRAERAPGTMIQRSSSSLCPPLQPAPPPWASLPQDLVQLIGWRVLAGDLLDYVRLRAVCAHWSSSTVSPHGRGVLDPRFHPRRWKLVRRLPEDDGDAGGYVRFSNLSTGASARVRRLPLLDDHVVLEPVDGGLLLLYRRRDTAVRLLHPFTGDVEELPPLSTLLPSDYCMEKGFASGLPGFLRRFFAAMIVVSAASDETTITVMLALGVINRVAHATPGDQRWTLSDWALPAWLKGWVVYHEPTKL